MKTKNNLSAQAKVRVTPEEVEHACFAYMGTDTVPADWKPSIVDKRRMLQALTDFAARLSQGAQGEAVGFVSALGLGALRRGKECRAYPRDPEDGRDYVAIHTHPAERAAVPDGLDTLTDEQLMEFVAIGLRHAEVKNFQIGDLRPAFKSLKAMLTAAPQPPEGARVVGGKERV